MAEPTTDATRKKGRAGRIPASLAAMVHPPKECAAHGPSVGLTEEIPGATDPGANDMRLTGGG